MQRPARCCRAQIEDRLYGWGERSRQRRLGVRAPAAQKLGADFITSMRRRLLRYRFVLAALRACCWPCSACWPWPCWWAASPTATCAPRPRRCSTTSCAGWRRRCDRGEVRRRRQCAGRPAAGLRVQVWTADGAASTRRARGAAQRAAGLRRRARGHRVWRSFSVAMPSRVIQVSQPLAIRRTLAADAAWRAVLPLLRGAWPPRRGGTSALALRPRCSAWPACAGDNNRWRRCRRRPADGGAAGRRANALLQRLTSRWTRSAPSSPTPRTSCARR